MKNINPSAADRLSPPSPLCGHDKPMAFSRTYKAVCPACRSYWDMDSLKAPVVYDRSYPELRSHFDLMIGTLKVRTLLYWLRKNHIHIEHLAICEVGFGGGSCLSYLCGSARRIYGIEAVPENIEHAVRLGIDPASLFRADSLPAALPVKVDLWIFQDSFEHLVDPLAFMKWAVMNSSPHAKILIIAPNGDCASEKILRRWWPHKISDHRFHWSKKGLSDFFFSNGFVVERDFLPLKFISLKMVLAHILLKAGWFKVIEQWTRYPVLGECTLLCNIGEMGLLLKRQ